MMNQRIPIVAIVGRPNVGKSTLFNRCLRRREAIVDDAPGITRDRKYGEVEWEGSVFKLIDTGGYIPKSIDVIDTGVKRQVEFAIQEADLILFLVDCQTGITDIDGEVTDILRKSEKPCILAVNKVDNVNREIPASEFYKLGLGDLMMISASAGRRIGDLLSLILNTLKQEGSAKKSTSEEKEETLKLAIVGRPNVGKSTFINTILGEERLLVTEIPGTTRDSVNVQFRYEGTNFILVDTAGLRRRSKVHENVEYYSNLRTQRALEHCDVACVFVSAEETITQQDMHVIIAAVRAKRAVMLVINKWDLIKKNQEQKEEWQQIIDDKMRGITYIPILRIASKTGYRVRQVLDAALQVSEQRKMRIASPKLNQLLTDLNRQYQPAAVRGKRVRVLYATQVGVNPPVFAFFSNYPELIKKSYRRFLENQIREQFGFEGVPITIVFKKK